MKFYHYIAFLILFNLTSSAVNKMVNHSEKQKNVKFWAGQLSEHAEFAAGFTTDATLKKRGKELMQQFRKIVVMPFGQNTEKQFLNLADSIMKYQKDVKTHLNKQSNKDLEKALLDHMNKETKYAIKKAEGKQLSLDEEVKFWSEEHEGEAHVIAQLMNPKAPQLQKDAQTLEKVLKSNVQKESLEVLETANQELNAIGQELEKDPSKTRIPAKLAAHEKREREYAAKIFNELKQAQ